MSAVRDGSCPRFGFDFTCALDQLYPRIDHVLPVILPRRLLNSSALVDKRVRILPVISQSFSHEGLELLCLDWCKDSAALVRAAGEMPNRRSNHQPSGSRGLGDRQRSRLAEGGCQHCIDAAVELRHLVKGDLTCCRTRYLETEPRFPRRGFGKFASLPFDAISLGGHRRSVSYGLEPLRYRHVEL